MDLRTLGRLLVPGLVLQAVMVGGGYATGRELVSFFLVNGPLSAITGMAVTAVLFSVTAIIAFELARLHSAFDYRSFCKTFMGRWWFLFEIGYIGALLLSLSVITAAAGELAVTALGLNPTLGAVLFVAVVALLLGLGTDWIERIITLWSVVFYGAYAAMFIAVFHLHGDKMLAALPSEPLRVIPAISGGVSFTGYNITIVAILIFVARNLGTRKQALWAGALTGPLILIPGFAFLLTLTAFYPQINDMALPVGYVLEAVGNTPLTGMINVIVSCALMKTGLALLHGLNERIAGAWQGERAAMPGYVRPAIAIAAMTIATLAATGIGLIDLIGKGYRYSGYYFVLIFLVPLFTLGLKRALAKHA